MTVDPRLLAQVVDGIATKNGLVILTVEENAALRAVLEAARITHDCFFSNVVSDRVAQQRARELGVVLDAADRTLGIDRS